MQEEISKIIVQSVLLVGLIWVLISSYLPSPEARKQRKKEKKFKKEVDSNYKKIMNSVKK